jgi:exonuclease III
MKIVYWNVQGLRRKAKEISNYLEHYDIIALTETWIEENDYQATERNLPKEYHWHWTSAVRRKARGRAAGGLVIGIRGDIEHKDFSCNMNGCWSSIMAKLGGVWYRIINIYNNTSLAHLKNEITGLIEESQERNLIIGGDWNARIGTLCAANSNEERSTKDKRINEEGSRWADLVNAKGLTLLNGNTMGDWDGEYTRLGLQDQEEAVLDYVAANSNCLPKIATFRVGGEAASDHFPTEITLQTKSCRAIENITVQKWNSRTKQQYTTSLRKKAAENWSHLRDKMWEATPKVTIRKGARRQNAWWNASCTEKRQLMLDEMWRQRSGAASFEDYRNAKKEYKKAIREAKDVFRTNFEKELNKVSNIQQGWEFINRFRKIKTTETARPSDSEFNEHFKKLLQGKRELVGPTTQKTSKRISLSLEELRSACRDLKENKAAGPDGLKSEALKYLDEATEKELHRQLEEALNGEIVPAQWFQATIWPIHKKGDPMVVTNYRGIAIGNAIQKLLATIVVRRLQEFVEVNEILPDTQNGFRQGRSTVDNLYILNAAINISTTSPGGKLFAFFVDFTTAFDTVNRSVLWAVMQRKGIPEELITTIRNMYSYTSYAIGEFGFESHTGVKQGCPLSPLLFAIYISELDAVLKRNQLGGVVLGRSKIHSLAFADDLAILARSAAELKDMIKAVHRFAAGRELNINDKKSKIMMFSRGGRKSGQGVWKVDKQTYEEVGTFRYLGVTLQRNGKFNTHRTENAAVVNRRTTEVWSIGERLFKNNFQLRMSMFQSLVLPIMTYAAEVTGYEAQEEYEKCQRRYVRWLLGLPRGTRKDILECEAATTSVAQTMKLRAVKYEWALKRKPSKLLLEARTAIWQSSEPTQWEEQRRKQMEQLGWGKAEAKNLFNSAAGYFLIRQRMEDIAAQQRESVEKTAEWYTKPKDGTPEYLRNRHPQSKIIARFRCGAEDWGAQNWRKDRLCRMCGAKMEDLEHLVTHDVFGRPREELLDESGGGIDWMLAVVCKQSV